MNISPLARQDMWTTDSTTLLSVWTRICVIPFVSFSTNDCAAALLLGYECLISSIFLPGFHQVDIIQTNNICSYYVFASFMLFSLEFLYHSPHFAIGPLSSLFSTSSKIFVLDTYTISHELLGWFYFYLFLAFVGPFLCPF